MFFFFLSLRAGGEITRPSAARRVTSTGRVRCHRMPLNPRQQQFVAGYLARLPASEAYRRAGYTCRSQQAAEAAASRLLRNVKVAEAIEAGRQRAERAADVKAADVIRGLYAEANNTGEGSSHSARVSAWVALGKHLGMFKDRVEHSGPSGGSIQHEHTGSGSVFDAIDKLTALFDGRPEGGGQGDGAGQSVRARPGEGEADDQAG
jgi:phage terminase small subunit